MSALLRKISTDKKSVQNISQTSSATLQIPTF